jgi:glycosyltransferase involved in cell wall biosynthesis
MRIAIQAENLVGGANFQHAGVGRYSYSIIEHLLRIGNEHEWYLMATRALEVPSEWTSRKNFHVKVIPSKFKTWRAIQRTPYLLRHRIDVFFVLTGPTCNHRLLKTAVTVHDLFPFDHPEAFDASVVDKMKALASQQISKSNLIFAVSKNTKDRVLMRFPSVPADSIIVTPNGPGNVGQSVPYASVSKERLSKLGVPFSRYFFTLGTLEPRKNLIRLIKAFGKLCEQTEQRDFGLVIGGGKGWKESSIFETVTELGLRDRIVFLGYVNDEYLPELFARSEAFICASIDEGFGIPVLEGMLYGTPVITSNRGALPEVGGDAVLYFDPEDIEEISQTMNAVLNGSTNREKMIADGIVRSKLFSWEETARTTLTGLLKLGSES